MGTLELTSKQIRLKGENQVVTAVLRSQESLRNLHPILRDEVYRIAGEAVRNPFNHAQAQRIEVEIRYDEREFRLRVWEIRQEKF